MECHGSVRAQFDSHRSRGCQFLHGAGLSLFGPLLFGAAATLARLGPTGGVEEPIKESQASVAQCALVCGWLCGAALCVGRLSGAQLAMSFGVSAVEIYLLAPRGTKFWGTKFWATFWGHKLRLQQGHTSSRAAPPQLSSPAATERLGKQSHAQNGTGITLQESFGQAKGARAKQPIGRAGVWRRSAGT